MAGLDESPHPLPSHCACLLPVPSPAVHFPDSLFSPVVKHGACSLMSPADPGPGAYLVFHERGGGGDGLYVLSALS